jgi:hypothetical protein
MSYNVSGTNMLQWFYPTSKPSIAPNNALTTNFRINNVDISNNYVGLGINSNIPVSQVHNINYFTNGQSIGNLFELNVIGINSQAVLNVDYKIWPPNNHGGLLIQFLRSTTFAFLYTIDCSFVIVGGGGGGGNVNQYNAGGGGGAGEVITGSIRGAPKSETFSVTIGDGGTNTNPGSFSYLTYSTISAIDAAGGGAGGNGKANSSNTTGSSSGGSGAYSNTPTDSGTVTSRNPLSNFSIFYNMISYGNRGSQGNDQNNDTGAGGGGGGAGAASSDPGNEIPGVGGNGVTITYGNTSFQLGGGGGGGGRRNSSGADPTGGAGGLGGGGKGGGPANIDGGFGQPGTPNTGGGGGGAQNAPISDGSIKGGSGGSGTVILYILPSGVRL